MSRTSLTILKRVHMIGIKGAGMAALAQIFVHQGKHVTGSDTSEVFFTDSILKSLNVEVNESFVPENIPSDAEMIVYSTSYSPERNPELRAAFEGGKPVLSYPEAVGVLTNEYLTLAVAGTHGKTTTSALLGHVLEQIDESPTAIVGSRIAAWGGGALLGTGQYLVLEADEYQNKLKEYQPFAVILTSADFDHPDFFSDAEAYEHVFREFVARIPPHGVLVYCHDSAAVVRVAEAAHCQKISYGQGEGALYQVTAYTALPTTTPKSGVLLQRFSVFQNGELFGEYALQLAGRHNALNATAIIALLNFLQKDMRNVGLALETFPGTERRFEYIGERFGSLLYDDYAHHPEEVRVTLRAFREMFPTKMLTVVFHPHTFTRTKALLQDFAQCFEDADRVYILDIYGSAREEQGGVSSQDIVNIMERFAPGKSRVAHESEVLIAELYQSMGRNDVIISLGAGDVWKVSHTLARSAIDSHR
ncbi:MAG: UDP-N-acetylmuramate--L-alanine ligase [Candidatus Moranbacteria bacterium]|jgi:UDP-N-acetylmuramate--alanine ligase|nr:UDP-N-acetylmuramate--L-alanine ligase [Candidatus Moranbacteria bacterium]